MEVHHHAHGHSGKKNWRNYFWEFLMLFLAVFCGFIAEYQLEHKIEKDREKAFISSMIEDLQADTLNLRVSLEDFTRRDKNFDTIFLNFSLLSKGYNQSLRSSMERIVGYRDFFPTDKTLQQLKNSGGMRLIQKKKALDGIVTYDAKIMMYQKSLHDLDQMFAKFLDINESIQDRQMLEKDRKMMSVDLMEKGSKNYLLKADEATLGHYYNRIKLYQLLRQVVERRMESLKTEAASLIEVLRETYHFD